MRIFKSITIIIISFPLFIYSQTEHSLFRVNHSEVQAFLDSIIAKYKPYTHPNGNKIVDYSYFLNTKSYYLLTYGEDLKLFNDPIKGSSFKQKLNFGDTIMIPMFEGKIEPSVLSFYEDCGELCWYDYFFCLTKNGAYGFIDSRNLIGFQNIYPIPNSNYLFFRGEPKVLVDKSDFTKRRYFNTDQLNFTNDSSICVYSIDSYKDYKSIYIFKLNSWEENYIGKGFKPKFTGNEIVYWNDGNVKGITEKVHLYSLVNNNDKVIFIVPDSLTLWEVGPDRNYPSEIQIKNIDNEECFDLQFCSKTIQPGEEECGKKAEFLISKTGNILKIE